MKDPKPIQPDDAAMPKRPQDVSAALACALSTACLLCWVPLARTMAFADWFPGTMAPAAILAFLMVASVASLFVPVLLEGASMSTRSIPIARAAIVLCGCAIALALEGKGMLEIAFLVPFGAGLALELQLWFRRFSQVSAASYAVGTICGLLLSTAFFALTLKLPNVVVYLTIAAAVACDAVASMRPRPAKIEGADGTTRSKLLDISAAQFVARFLASFFLLGVLTGVMLALFAMGPKDRTDYIGLLWLPVGVLVLALLLILGWVRNHEPDFTLTLGLTLVVALAAFFPFYPGTEFNQRLSLALGSVWLSVICGSFLLVSKEAELACSPAGKHPFGPGLAALFMGGLCGTATMVLVIGSAWYSDLGNGPFGRTMFVTGLGATSIALAYVCTNILLNRDRLRSVRLLARGSFVSLVTPSGVGGPDADTAGTSLESTCREIALRYALTPREHDVLVILARGNGMARVQEELVISEGTAITHRRNLYRKLGVANKQELIDLVEGRSQA